MARFTSIGMPKKAFVDSTAEEADLAPEHDAGPSSVPVSEHDLPGKKRKRNAATAPTTKEHVDAPHNAALASNKAWGRNPEIARKTQLAVETAEARRQKRSVQRGAGTTCFACRAIGHAARDCPTLLLAQQPQGGGTADLLGEPQDGQGGKRGMKRAKGKKGGDVVGGNCYRCNSTAHSLSLCPEVSDPSDPTPYATCFLCLSMGHLSSKCPTSKKGIYVNGGSCKVCGSVEHRAQDCPKDKRKYDRRENTGGGGAQWRGDLGYGGGGRGVGADEDDFMVASREGKDGQEGKRRKREKHPPANNGLRVPKRSVGEVAGGLAEAAVRSGQRMESGAGAPPVVKSVAAPKAKPKVISF